MRLQKFVIIIAFILGVGIFSIYTAFNQKPATRLDMVEINDITKQLEGNWVAVKALGYSLPQFKDQIDYVVIDQDENLIAVTRQGLNETIHEAVSHQDTIIDLKKGDLLLGKMIIRNNAEAVLKQLQSKLLMISLAVLIVVTISCLIYIFIIHYKVFQPFRKMKGFAQSIARGELDVPLEMDRSNHFGAFTESFDLMREELGKARENERIANQSKKELVATLSHDIKTPVASIKATSELMQIKSEDPWTRSQLEVIEQKADQINLLITNLFQATLEELQELKVNPTEESSKLIASFIQNADYKAKAEVAAIPDCLFLADPMRLQQVFDNIISNSYKYANTKIAVTALIDSDKLIVTIKDFGSGVSSDELILLTNKFYQGENAKGKSGSGLGLYIAKFLMNRMNGELSCENQFDGFAVHLKLTLIGNHI